MLGFFQTLINLIQQYSIADTANVFAIVEGIATVVAAVGAIIAVIVTRKIAKRQIEIAEKQNEISDKQANIALQQNEIAMFDKKFETYQQFSEFLTLWRIHIKASLDEKQNNKRIFACMQTIEFCSTFGSNIELLSAAYFENNDFPTELNLFLLGLQKESVFMIFKIPLLFKNVQLEEIQGLIDAYQGFMNQMRSAITRRQVLRGFVKAANDFKKELQRIEDARMLTQMKTELKRIEE